MERRRKVELFEQLRREYEFGVGTIAGVARKFGVHRRMVRQAVECAVPPERKRPVRRRPKLDQVRDFINTVLESDRKSPRKQRHTAHRIYVRLCDEASGCRVSERTVRHYVRERKAELGLLRRAITVPQVYACGVEAQVDWYEAVVTLDGERRVIQVFAMRSMASGAAFHRAYLRATQQAFLEAHELAFRYFGGVFRRLRYDNLTSAVKKVLRGSQREECERFVAFRSHWRYEASFCSPAQPHEKGGVEGEVGYFRRNHLVPVPSVSHLAALNELLAAGCRRDEARVISGRASSVGEGMTIERPLLLPLAAEDFELAEECFCRVDTKGCVQVRTNFYSTPLHVGTQARVRLLASEVEVWHSGQRVAVHERCYGRRQQVLSLEHYLDVLVRKPGALAGSKPLQQWRTEGRWTSVHDQLWQQLKERHGAPAGTRLMIELVQLGRQYGYEQLSKAIATALELGATDAAAVRYLLSAPSLQPPAAAVLPAAALGSLEHYQRPLPVVGVYDQLLGKANAGVQEAQL